MMHRQTAEFAVERKNGVIRAGRFEMKQPKTDFKGGSVKWYKDSMKKGGTGNRK